MESSTLIKFNPFLLSDVSPQFSNQTVKLQKDVDPTCRYEILPELGRGSFGTVFLCREKNSGLQLAAKIVPCKKKQNRADMEREIDIMSCLRHPRLIEMYDAFDFDDHMYVILEL